jgi:hypothetical protein
MNGANFFKIAGSDFAAYMTVVISACAFSGDSGRSDSVCAPPVDCASLLHADVLMLDLPDLRDVLYFFGIEIEGLARHILVVWLLIGFRGECR